eukprot:Colp12_sorted_trinity150504_noHs@15705
MQRLELYSRNMVDHHMILDTLPILTQLLFQGRMPEIRLSYLQVAIILATGLQHRDVDSIGNELNLPANQVLAFFNKTVRKITSHLRGLIETDAALTLPSNEQVHRIELNVQGMTALSKTLDQDQRADELEFNAKQAQRNLIMSHKDLTKHTVEAGIDELEHALNAGLKKQLAVPKVISVPKGSVLPALTADDLVDEDAKKEGKKRSLEEEPTNKTPSKHGGGKDWKTDKKKDKSAKKSKRESI